MDSIVPQLLADYWNAQRRENKRQRAKMNPFEMKEEHFRSLFRFPPALAIKLIEELEIFAHQQDPPVIVNQRATRIPFHIKCLVAFNFYATGSYQNQIKCIGHMSQTSISKCIHEVSNLLDLLASKYIVFPETEEERCRIASEFAKKGIPGIIGLIDGTHIAVAGLKKDIEMAYVNRKGVHSINTLIAVNDRNLITYINARFPGSCHDSFIFGSSLLLAMFEDEYTSHDDQKYWLLGDQGFALMPFLLTICDGNLTSQQELYNRYHKIIRSQVERAIGMFKNRFRCILGERKLRYNPVKCCKIINAVAVCHNFLIINNYEDEFSTGADANEMPAQLTTTVTNARRSNRNNSYLADGRLTRDRVINLLH